MRSRLMLGGAGGVLLVVVSLLASGLAPADPQTYDGPQRVQTMNGKIYEGEVVRQGDKYIVRPTKYKGMEITLRKSEVHRIDPLPKPAAGEDAATAGGGGGGGAGREAPLLTAEEIAALLKDLDVDPDSLGLGSGTDEGITVNEESVAEMMEIAGAGAKAARLETEHFVLVYTSSLPLARNLASRLEKVYQWNVNVLKQLGLPYHPPEHKLEIFFFGQHPEYARYQNVLGQEDSLGTLGFYRPDLNRSAFFDMETWPPILRRIEQAKSGSYAERQRIRLENERWVEWQNFEVVQHEAAHHIHFNIGVFSREVFARSFQGGASLPRWTVEGFATMFEMPETSLGASLGVLNHQRLKQFRETFGEDGSGLPDMRSFILNDSVFLSGGGRYYPLGWALSHYMWHKKRDQYGKWLKALSELGDHDEFTDTDRQRLFEDIFGKFDDKWKKEWLDYLKSLQLNTRILPPEIMR
jgi:hypothetical protein